MHILLIYKLTTKAQGFQTNQKIVQMSLKTTKIINIFKKNEAKKMAPHSHTKTSQCPHWENQGAKKQAHKLYNRKT